MLILLLLFSFSNISSQIIRNNFENFTLQDGLPANEVSAIIQDHLGYIWIGTNNGLSVYNGYDFVNYSPVVQDTNFLQLPLIKSLYEDSRGNIWIGAVSGLTKYSRINDSFKLYRLQDFEAAEERTMLITHISETSNGDIIFSTADIWVQRIKKGLYVWRHETDKIEAIQPASGEETNIVLDFINITDDNYLVCGQKGLSLFDYRSNTWDELPYPDSVWAVSIVPVKDNTFWIGTDSGFLVHYNLTERKYKLYDAPESMRHRKGVGWLGMFNMIKVEEQDLLMATNQGLLEFNTDSKTFSITRLDIKNLRSIRSNDLNDIMLDNSGSIWVATQDAGINKYNLTENNFSAIVNSSTNGMPSGWIDKIVEPNKNELWFSINNNIWRYNLTSKTFDKLNLPDRTNILGLYIDSENQVWMTGYNTFLRMNPVTKSITKVDLPESLKNNAIFTAFEDSKGTFWLGTNSGLYSYDRGSGSTAAINFQKLGLGSPISNSVLRLAESNDNLWIGSDDGLFKYDLKSKQVSRLGNSSDSSKSFKSQDINALYVDEYGKIWVGTWLGGLECYDPVSGKVLSYTKAEGLGSHSVQGILGDEENGALWLSTFDGIARFDLEKKTFSNFDVQDGIHNNQFADASALKTSGGLFVFGGQNGVTMFKSGDIQNNLSIPNIILTDFRIFNESVNPGNNSILAKPVYETKNIVLDYDENDIALDYLTTHYVNPKRNKYAYRLTNYENDWRYVGNQRTAIYPNLPPGEYVFELKASNNNEVWTEHPLALAITIKTPWWRSYWAYLSYLLLFSGFLYTVRQFELSRRKKNSEIKENQLRAQAAEAQSRAIQAENDRQTKELAEARELQLSMLPKELPRLANLDIAVYMQTATEVGGDYYDFHVGLDGTLTVVLGDATGHGMKAGTVVTTTKSLFSVLASRTDIVETFHEMTKCLKQMQLQKLSMCMTMLKINGNKLTMSAAGMPPVFIIRPGIDVVEEHVFKGMPLGTMDKFPYSIKETNLESGDTIVLMSDGMPELLDDNGELFGYKRIRDLLETDMTLNSEEIINKLKSEGSKWINGKDPDDDVTLVVIKVK